MSISVNYSRVILNQEWGKTSLTLGLGYYHAVFGLTENDQNYSNTTTTSGTFTGDVPGGTIGVDQSLSFNNSFGLDFSFKGRLATFSQLIASNVTPPLSTSKSPYALVVIKNENTGSGLSSNTDYLLFTQQGFNPDYYRYAIADYSGFSGDISLYFHF